MREIKFRAWDLKSKSFYKPTYEAYNGKLHDISITLNGFVMERTLEVNASMLNSDNYILMQFTGLTDKNGVEIFEGDFDKDYQVVRWCDNRNGWAMSTYDFPTKEHICCHCYECDGDFDISEALNDIEIIGNIYENSSLL